MLRMVSSIKKLFVVFLTLWNQGCGQGFQNTELIELPIELNDPLPSGTIVAQAAFTGQNGKTASGLGVIYNQSGGSYVLRLSGVNFPTEAGLQLIIVANSTNQGPLLLRSSSGNQNYHFYLEGASPVFNQIRLHSVIQFKDYATALLIH